MTSWLELSLLDFITAVSPLFKTPYHLAEWCRLIERCLVGGVRGCVSVPIRHHKTWTTAHGVAWLLLHDPTIRIIVMAADHGRCVELGKMIRRLCDQVSKVTGADIAPMRGENLIEDWKNSSGGGVIVMGAEQSKLGRDCDVLICDDVITEKTAEDFKVRDFVDHAIGDYTARVGRPSRRGSVLIVMSRWHPDDPIGRRELREGWLAIRHPAILDEGTSGERAFAPEIMDLKEIKLRRDEWLLSDPTGRKFEAQFMNNPKSMAGALFRPDPERYSKLPEWNFRLAYGVDLAYTQGEHSDYFAIVVVKIIGTKCYVIETMRTKLDAHMIESTCRAMIAKYGDAPFYSYVSGPEVGMVKLMRERGLKFVPLRARYNKLVRAERTIKRWNDLAVALPAEAAWVPAFLKRVELFSGNDKNGDDDEIDALVSVCDGAMGGVAGGSVRTVGKAYAGF